MAEAFKGKWTEESVDNFENYMKALEVGLVLRKVGGATKANEEWIINGDDLTVKITSTFKNKTLNFKLGEEFDEETMDGRKVKSTITIEDGKIKHQQVGKPHNCLYYRELKDDKLHVTMTVQAPTPVTANRVFKRV